MDKFRDPGTLLPMRTAVILSTLLAATAVAALCGCGSRSDRLLVETLCSRCHSPEVAFEVRGRSLDEWRRVVASMRARGAVLTDGEADRVARYLANPGED